MKSNKPYNLEDRTYAFALDIRIFLRNTIWDPVSWSDIKQLLRSSGSVAANDVESIEAISPDDCVYRLRLCKKEARESGLWLQLISDSNPIDDKIHRKIEALIAETKELVKIFVTMIRNKTAQPTLP
jgi:four helix bundle protein